MEPISLNTNNLALKKDLFIKTRKEDIKLFYEFSPKVTSFPLRSWEKAPMA